MSSVDEIAAYLAHLKTGGNRIDQIIFDELPNGEGMTATDELRRLLDERGIEYEPIDSVRSPNRRTLWGKVERGKGILGLDAKYETIEFKKGMRLTISDCSPTQAVEATLGRGTCRMESFIYEDTGAFIECSECGWQLFDADYSIDAACEWLGYCPNCGAKVVDA